MGFLDLNGGAVWPFFRGQFNTTPLFRLRRATLDKRY
jgi:hypothetical protein